MGNACLTTRQKKFYEYFTTFYKKNGYFPNASQAARDLDSSGPSVAAMYGTLFLKGAFTNGQALTDSYAPRHNTVKVEAFNVSGVKFKVQQKQAKPRQYTEKQVATMLRRLLGNAADSSVIGEVNNLFR